MSFCNHETLYGLRCAIVSNSIFSTIFVDTILSVLPLSTIIFHTLSLFLQAILNKLFLWTGFSTSFSGFARIFLIIRDIPPSTYSSSTFHLFTYEMRDSPTPSLFLLVHSQYLCLIFPWTKHFILPPMPLPLPLARRKVFLSAYHPPCELPLLSVWL
jgi:hypothetical protein